MLREGLAQAVRGCGAPPGVHLLIRGRPAPRPAPPPPAASPPSRPLSRTQGWGPRAQASPSLADSPGGLGGACLLLHWLCSAGEGEGERGSHEGRGLAKVEYCGGRALGLPCPAPPRMLSGGTQPAAPGPQPPAAVSPLLAVWPFKKSSNRVLYLSALFTGVMLQVVQQYMCVYLVSTS